MQEKKGRRRFEKEEKEEAESTKKPINDRTAPNRGYDAFRHQICHATKM
jgi:hypothetical protein